MKRTVLFVALATLVMTFASCEKDKDGWKKFYGYSANDIGGSYSYSNVPNAFESLTEGEFCRLCPDAEITIAPSGDNAIRFVMKSEEAEYNKAYQGKAPLNSHDFMIDIEGNTQVYSSTSFLRCFLNARVYQNADGQIRLEGNSAHNRYKIQFHVIYDEQHNPVDTIPDTSLYSSTRYYFDVIKN